MLLDPDPNQHSQYGSMQILIHDTGLDPESWVFCTQHFEFGSTFFFYEDNKSVHGVTEAWSDTNTSLPTVKFRESNFFN